jgi:hypothetical protein
LFLFGPGNRNWKCRQPAFSGRSADIRAKYAAVIRKLEYTTVGFQLLPEKFTLTELQEVYEAILGKQLDKRNFRRKLSLLKILKPLPEYRRGGQRPAQLYRFVAARFEKLKDKGILFPF